MLCSQERRKVWPLGHEARGRAASFCVLTLPPDDSLFLSHLLCEGWHLPPSLDPHSSWLSPGSRFEPGIVVGGAGPPLLPQYFPLASPPPNPPAAPEPPCWGVSVEGRREVLGDEVQGGDQYCVRKQASRNFWVDGKKRKQFGSRGLFHGGCNLCF